MRLHRFYVEQKIGESGEITLADSELIHQMVNVFRFKIGDKVILFDDSGFEYETEIIFISKKEVKLNIVSSLKREIERQKKVSLYLSLIKKSNFELAAEKCTEIGVSEIHPIISERSEKKDLNLERLNKIVKEASEQSGRVTLPKVLEIMGLEEAVSQAVKDGKRCVTFHTDSTATSFKITQTNSLHLTQTCLRRQANHSESCLNNFEGEVMVFVGPEGGWTDSEIELFKKNNFQICSLGQNILRAETAAMIAVWEAVRM
jgi:16S rRNA (uracil1498-N3)-methyltransferase